MREGNAQGIKVFVPVLEMGEGWALGLSEGNKGDVVSNADVVAMTTTVAESTVDKARWGEARPIGPGERRSYGVVQGSRLTRTSSRTGYELFTHARIGAEPLFGWRLARFVTNKTGARDTCGKRG